MDKVRVGRAKRNPTATPTEVQEFARRLHALWNLDHKTAPYKMLEQNDAHERRLAKKVQGAAVAARRLAPKLKNLSALLLEVHKERRGGPFARWLWCSSPEGSMGKYRLQGEVQQPANTPPWERPPGGGVAFVAKILADSFEEVVAKRLAEDAAKSKTRKGGRPRAVLFNAACRILAEEGRTEEEIAELVCGSRIVTGTHAKVRERVRVVLNRQADRSQDVHPLESQVAAIVKAEEEAWRRFLERNPNMRRPLGERRTVGGKCV